MNSRASRVDGIYLPRAHSTSTAATALCAKPICSTNSTNPPDGQITQNPVKPSRKNILIFRNRKSGYIRRIPSQQEGAFRERHGRRGGDAVDVAARETGEAGADGEIVWF